MNIGKYENRRVEHAISLVSLHLAGVLVTLFHVTRDLLRSVFRSQF